MKVIKSKKPAFDASSRKCDGCNIIRPKSDYKHPGKGQEFIYCVNCRSSGKRHKDSYYPYVAEE